MQSWLDEKMYFPETYICSDTQKYPCFYATGSLPESPRKVILWSTERTQNGDVLHVTRQEPEGACNIGG
jgi:hypothetical protein